MQDLGKDIGKLFDSIDVLRGEHSKARSSPFASANEEAMDTFINKKKAEDMENELREIILATRGYDAWQELIRLRAEIKRKRTEQAKAKELARMRFYESLWTWVGVGVIVLGVTIVAVFVLAALQSSGTLDRWLGR